MTPISTRYDVQFSRLTMVSVMYHPSEKKPRTPFARSSISHSKEKITHAQKDICFGEMCVEQEGGKGKGMDTKADRIEKKKSKTGKGQNCSRSSICNSG